jgi:sterol desaturase/sphingolipid hydroxylase (fatty acid hydroxylase superfamily)
MATALGVHRALQLAQLAAFLALVPAVKPHWEGIVHALGGPKWANVLGVTALHALVLLLGNAFFYALYVGRFPSIEAHKVLRAPWPWACSEEQRTAFTALVLSGAGLTVLNLCIAVPMAVLNYDVATKLGHSAAIEAYPTIPRVVASILAFTLIEDALFYWAHRSMHSRWLYPHVHKVHHRFTHSVSIAAEATHPFEFVLGNALPFVAGPLLTGAHLFTLYMWTVWRIGETVANHSGYDLPWSVYSLIPGQGTATAHDLHHSVNTGNFSSFFTHWDSWCGTAIHEGTGRREGHSKSN